MLKRVLNIIRKTPSSPEDMLVREAHATPRYEEHNFRYRNFSIACSDFLSVAYQVKEYFADERMRFKAGEKPLIIDCGANVGISVLYFKLLYPGSRIIAFEPDPHVFTFLKRNVTENKVQGVELVNKAVWKDTDGIEFGVEGADGGSVFFEKGKKIKVPTCRLKDEIEKHAAIDLLKIDIEGAETEVLKDCESALGKVKNLFIEYHSWTSKKQELDVILAILTRSGFRYYIHSIGNQATQPFVVVNPDNGMDVQLDIYAVKQT